MLRYMYTFNNLNSSFTIQLDHFIVIVILIQAVSGRYISQSFNPDNGNFTLVFSASISLAPQPTIIYLNEKFYYPNGYNVG